MLTDYLALSCFGLALCYWSERRAYRQDYGGRFGSSRVRKAGTESATCRLIVEMVLRFTDAAKCGIYSDLRFLSFFFGSHRSLVLSS